MASFNVVKEFSNTFTHNYFKTGLRVLFSYGVPVAILSDNNRLIVAESYPVQGTIKKSKTTTRHISKFDAKHRSFERLHVSWNEFNNLLRKVIE